MKRCPFCAEEIQDEAVKCRYCGSDLGERPEGRAEALQPDRPTRVMHMGSRYAIGTGEDFFGIWDSQAPGSPVQRFTASDEGWQEALRQYAGLEPGAAVPSPSAATRASGPAAAASPAPAAEQTNGFAIASLVLGIVWIWWVGSILALVFGYVARSQIKRTGQSGNGLAIAGIVLGWIGVGTLLFYVIMFVVAMGQIGQLNEQLSPSPAF